MPVLKLLKSRSGGPLLEASWKGFSFIHPTCVATQSVVLLLSGQYNSQLLEARQGAGNVAECTLAAKGVVVGL